LKRKKRGKRTGRDCVLKLSFTKRGKEGKVGKSNSFQQAVIVTRKKKKKKSKKGVE